MQKLEETLFMKQSKKIKDALLIPVLAFMCFSLVTADILAGQPMYGVSHWQVRGKRVYLGKYSCNLMGTHKSHILALVSEVTNGVKYCELVRPF